MEGAMVIYVVHEDVIDLHILPLVAVVAQNAVFGFTLILYILLSYLLSLNWRPGFNDLPRRLSRFVWLLILGLFAHVGF